MAGYIDAQRTECTLLLKSCLQSASDSSSGIRRAVVENSQEQLHSLLVGASRPRLNKLWKFSLENGLLLIPPLCVAVCHHNLVLVQCLLHHGPSANRSSSRGSVLDPFVRFASSHKLGKEL